MSLIPFAPFSKLSQRGLEVFALSDLSLLTSDLRLLTSGYAALRSLSAVRTDSPVASSLLPRSKLWSQSLVKAQILLAKCIKNDTVSVVDRPLPAVFFRTESGREPVREWLQGLQKHERKIIGIDVMTVQYRWPLGMPLGAI